MKSLKVLIADDDRVLSQVLSARLTAKGWTVQAAYDAMQTVMFAMRLMPDAIVLDVHMPGGTGIAALKQLKASAKTSQIPVLVLSGSTDAAEADGPRALGASQFVFKPVDPDVLHDMLVQLVTRGVDDMTTARDRTSLIERDGGLTAEVPSHFLSLSR